MEQFYQLVIYFAIFSFSGWVVETIFCSIKDGHFVYRGFLNGPVCPVYGFGGLIVVYLLAPVQDNLILLFLLGMVSTTILEYITHYILEKLFHAKWWDYSKLPFNINGRVCLYFSLMFGGLSVVAVKVLYPPYYKVVHMIPLAYQPAVAWSLLTLFGADLVITVWSLLSVNGVLQKAETALSDMQSALERMEQEGLSTSEKLHVLRTDLIKEEKIAESVSSLLSKLKKEEKLQVEDLDELSRVQMEGKVKGLRRFQLKRLSQAFPRIEYTKYKEQWQALKDTLAAKKEKIKKK